MEHAKDLVQQIWSMLSEAATSPGNGFTLMNIATIGSDGGPRARSVILREFLRSPERICFATHAWSDKVAEIQDNPAVAVTFYDRERSAQLRVEGIAHVLGDDAERLRAWQNLAPHSQEQYVSRAIPGDEYEAQRNDDLSTAFQRFAWISVELRRLDWLDLATEPHHRWQVERTEDGWRGQRVVP